jgi:hypothetical protein
MALSVSLDSADDFIDGMTHLGVARKGRTMGIFYIPKQRGLANVCEASYGTDFPLCLSMSNYRTLFTAVASELPFQQAWWRRL